jgi:dTDP-4-dehydrorhamnose 3,5-epimerase
MRFNETAIDGSYLVDIEPRGDHRGFFARLWCREEFSRHGLTADFVQCNGSYSAQSGTLRGLHYQTRPFEEVKLVRCIRGSIFDVVVDLRRDSRTYRRWLGVTLTADERRMMYVPRGCAHGYLTLEDHSEVEYPVSEFYKPEAERGLRWDDPAFGIKWPAPGVQNVSSKDGAWPDYQE